jgi:hypothetical protein
MRLRQWELAIFLPRLHVEPDDGNIIKDFIDFCSFWCRSWHSLFRSKTRGHDELSPSRNWLEDLGLGSTGQKWWATSKLAGRQTFRHCRVYTWFGLKDVYWWNSPKMMSSFQLSAPQPLNRGSCSWGTI